MQDDAKVLTLLGFGESPCTDERGCWAGSMLLAAFRVKTKRRGCQSEKGSAIIAQVLGNFRLGPAMGAK